MKVIVLDSAPLSELSEPVSTPRVVAISLWAAHSARKSLSVCRSLLCRCAEIVPMEPMTVLRGNTARKPSRISDSDFKPLPEKSGSEGEMHSSNPLTS